MLRRSRALLLATCLAGCGTFLGLGNEDDDDAPTTTSSDASAGDSEGDTTVSLGEDGATGADGGGGDADAGADAAKDADADVGLSTLACNGATACTRYVFVTSATYLGNFGESTADAKCKDLADATASASVLKGRQWRAWLSRSTPAQDAKDRIVKGSAPYRRVDGAQIAADAIDLLDGTIGVAINLDEKGAPQNGVPVWTATDATGSRISVDCVNWTSIGNGQNAKVGDSSKMDTQWTNSNAGDRACSQAAHLYCFEY